MGFEDEVRSISTPDQVDTSIGELTFFDGAPTSETVARVYDYLDTARRVGVFLNAVPGASVRALVHGPRSLGQQRSNQVVIFDKLMSSESLFLTGNTSTLGSYDVSFAPEAPEGREHNWLETVRGRVGALPLACTGPKRPGSTRRSDPTRSRSKAEPIDGRAR